MPFDVGQPVIINDVIASRHSGKRAVIVECRPSRRKIRTLDKYVVKTADGEVTVVWGIQLKIDDPRRAASEVA
jgi:hypothetical protein